MVTGMYVFLLETNYALFCIEIPPRVWKMLFAGKAREEPTHSFGGSRKRPSPPRYFPQFSMLWVPRHLSTTRVSWPILPKWPIERRPKYHCEFSIGIRNCTTFLSIVDSVVTECSYTTAWPPHLPKPRVTFVWVASTVVQVRTKRDTQW